MIRRALQILALLLLPGIANAQISTATLSGVLTDPSNAVVAGADVTATHIDTNRAFKISTDSSGRYFLSALPVGRYKVSVSSPGFKTLERDFELNVNQLAVRPGSARQLAAGRVFVNPAVEYRCSQSHD